MLSPPEDLDDAQVLAAVSEGWSLSAGSAAYRAVGFGSHHWELTGADGRRWFVSIDEIHAEDDAHRLRAALGTARGIRDAGLEFVVAPLATVDGDTLLVVGRFAVALYPFVEGETFAWGERTTDSHREAVTQLLIELHRAPTTIAPGARHDDLAIDRRAHLEGGLRSPAPWDGGPYAGATFELLRTSRDGIEHHLRHYDELVAALRRRADGAVITHGEPHPGNTIRGATGWALVDWDTALIASPERDLWNLDPGDGSVLDTYAAATGHRPDDRSIELHRLRWDLADLVEYVGRFRRPHTGDRNDEESWRGLNQVIDKLR